MLMRCVFKLLGLDYVVEDREGESLALPAAMHIASARTLGKRTVSVKFREGEIRDFPTAEIKDLQLFDDGDDVGANYGIK
jgi:hypothetical protein